MSDMQGGAPAGEGPTGMQGGTPSEAPAAGPTATTTEEPRTQAGEAGAGSPPPIPPGTGQAWPGGPGEHRPGPRHGGVVFGIVLIAIGALVLIGQLTRISDVLRLWPLIIIIGGVAQMVRWGEDGPIKRIAEGLGTIAFGLVLLGNTFGVIPWTVWLTMLSLWPVLLVGLGIELVGRALHANWIRALTNVLFIAALAYGVFVLGPGWHGGAVTMNLSPGAGIAYQTSSPHDPAVATGNASLKLGAIRFTVGAGDTLAQESGTAPNGEAPRLTTSTTGGVANVEVTDPVTGVVTPPTTLRTLALTLDRTVHWNTITLDLGAAESDVDLRDLAVDNVEVHVGASSLQVWVGDKAPTANVDISGGVTSVSVVVPKDATVTLDSSSGLSSVSVPSDFEHVSGFAALGESSWKKPGSGTSTIHITLKSGVSNLEVLTY